MRAILLTYGHKATLRSSLDRARRFADAITIVPALPSATRGLRTHASPLVEIAPAVGREGLAHALGRLEPSTPVLLLHDDVLLGAEAAHALVSTADGDVIAVPRSNQPDADGYVGELPADVVQPLGPETTVTVGERFRPSALAATVARITALLPHRITSADTIVHLPDGSLHVVDGAVATHLDRCRAQRETPPPASPNPLLVATMIVRDEEDELAECLASLEGIVDRVDIVDTGSVDSTVEIATAAGARVEHREWRDDFGWARTEALGMARDAHYVLVIDADERVRVPDPAALREFLATSLADPGNFEVWLDDVDEDGEVVDASPVPRIFPAADTEYRGRVHELPMFEDDRPMVWSVLPGFRMTHTGYQAAKLDERDKAMRNLRLAQASFDEDPTPWARLNLARSLKGFTERADERLALLESLMEEIVGPNPPMNEAAHTVIALILANDLWDRGRREDAFDVLQRMHEKYPASSPIRARHAQIGVQLGRFEEVALASRSESEDAPQRLLTPAMEVSGRIESAKAELATGDTASAFTTALQIIRSSAEDLEPGSWRDVLSIIAVSGAPGAIDALLEASATDRSGIAASESMRLLAEEDRLEFAETTLQQAPQATVAQRFALMSELDDPTAAVHARQLAGSEEDVVTELVLRLASGTQHEESVESLLPHASSEGRTLMGQLVEGAEATEVARSIRALDLDAAIVCALRRLPATSGSAVARELADRVVGSEAQQLALTTAVVADDPATLAAIADAAEATTEPLRRDTVEVLLNAARSRGRAAAAQQLEELLPRAAD